MPLWKNLKGIVNLKKRFNTWNYPIIEESKPTKHNWIVQNMSNMTLGKYTDIGAMTYINAQYGVTIEEGVQIGSHCSIYSISTIDDKTGPILLKRNCSIGTHSTIMPGVTIGENSIVGAYSLVLKDIPKNVVAFGIPAKIIRRIDE